MSTPNRRPVRILVAEDDPMNAETLGDYLRSRGMEVHLVATGLQALQAAEEFRPDAMVMDIRMPELDGLEATRRIRQHPDPEVAQIPVVMATAHAGNEVEPACMQAGASAFLTKPFALVDLMRLLSELLPNDLVSASASLAAFATDGRGSNDRPIPTKETGEEQGAEWLRGARILVVDDDIMLVQTLRDTLSSLGSEVRAVSAPHECLREAAAFLPELIILDAMMPGVTGFELAEALKADSLQKGTAHSPEILMLTALSSQEAMARGFGAGADDFLTKPYARGELILRSGNLLAARRRKERIKDLMRSREELASAVVHDLRSPLSVIVMNATVLARLTDASVAAMLDDILVSARSMSDLLDDLLLAARSEARELIPVRKWISLEDLLNTAVARAQAASSTRAQISAMGVGRAFLDQALSLRLLDNLVGNALKHATVSGPPTVQVRARAMNGVLTLEVEDDGPGVPADLREKIFTRFSQGTRGGSGHGLGLHFCRLATEAHGGTIEVLEGAMKGALFRVTLPQEVLE